MKLFAIEGRNGFTILHANDVARAQKRAREIHGPHGPYFGHDATDKTINELRQMGATVHDRRLV